ncbi:MAG: PilZ domain-containing protein [Deltaproteobacteria bacterium]|nr:PilZ domain-containing protein [Deltaproteobacteria bacterium]
MKMLDEIIKRVHNLTQDQQKEILGTLRTLQAGKRREFRRLKIKADIDVVVGDRVIQTDIGDISANGVFINASGKFEINKSVRVVFSVSGVGRPFKLEGSIVRVAETGIAIKFENTTSYFKEILNNVIWGNKNLG